ncbi:MAG: type II secretion system protein N [Allosphingosinicella sp.]|uniref:type II secretion system protein N n=1 Tax=Allosphingosinicella sp. TaxID=2823234 RepID=UPI00392A4142
MRVRLPVGRTLFFLGAFALALLVSLPLRLALDWLNLGDRGLAAREARGSVWSGRLAEAQYGHVPLGDVDAGLSPLPLVIGRARVELERGGREQGFRGAATVASGGFSLDDLRGRIAMGAALAPLPVAALDLRDVTARFADGLCAAATGAVEATLTGDAAALMLPATLTGTARCAEGALLLPLASQSGMEQLSLRIWGDGRFRADLMARPSDPALSAGLEAAGFRPMGGGYAARAEGSF